MAVTAHEIMSSSLDGHVRQYDLRAGKLRVDSVGQTVMNACYSNDGNCVLISTLDSRVRLLDKMEGDLLNEYRGHRNEQYRTQSCLSYDDALVVSGSEDHNIYIWDLVEAQLKATLVGHSHVVACLVYSPTQHMLCSGSIDSTVVVWKRV